MENVPQPARFDTIVALSIAVVSVVSAVLVGVATLSSEVASDAERSALIASINREKADVSAHTELFQDMRAFAEFRALDALARETDAEAAEAEQRGEIEAATRLRDEAQANRAAADSMSAYFASAYLLDENSFDEETFVADVLQFEQSVNDLDPTDDVSKAEVFLNRGALISASVAGMTVSLFLLILAQISKRKIRYVWYAAGMFVGVCGLIAVIGIEIARVLELL